MESLQIKTIIIIFFLIISQGKTMIVRPVEIYVKLINATSGPVVVNNGLESQTLNVGECLSIVFWQFLAVTFPDGYCKEINCHNLPEKMDAKATVKSFGRLKVKVEHQFKLTDEEILYLSGEEIMLYKKLHRQIHYDDIIIIDNHVEPTSFSLMKIKNEGIVPIHLEVFSMEEGLSPKLSGVSPAFQTIQAGKQGEFLIPNNIQENLTLQIKTDCIDYSNLECRICHAHE